LPSKPASWIRRWFPPAAPPAGEPFAWLRFLHLPIALVGLAWSDPHAWPLYVAVLITLSLIWPFHIQLTEGVEIYLPETWTSAAAAYLLGPGLLPVFWLSTSFGFAAIVVLDRLGLVQATGITAETIRQMRGEPFPPGNGTDGHLRQFINVSSHGIRVLVAAAVARVHSGAPGLATVIAGETAVALWLLVAPIPGRMAPARARARFTAALGRDVLVATVLLQVVMVWFLLVVFQQGGVLGFVVGSVSTLTLYAILKRLNDTRVESERQRLALIQVRDELGRRQRLAAIGQTASSVFHQIARHHGAIGMFAHLLGQEADRQDGADGTRWRATVGEHASRIVQSVDDANQVIESLLRFGQDRSLNLYPQSVAALVAECVSDCEARAVPRGIRVSVAAPVDATIAVDKHKMKQAIGNVLDNAIEVTDAGAAVEVDVTADAAGVRIAVRDHGPGVAPEVRDRLFTPFCTTKPHGIGLGLALARELVEAHGGHIDFHSTPHGTTFTLTLPTTPNGRH
jgi:signal transduction histidine kinase